MQCEICGFSGNLNKATVEGIKMQLCDKCMKYGKKVYDEVPVSDNITRKQRAFNSFETLEETPFVNNLEKLVKQNREKLNLKQSELAQKISEKESVIHQIESGTLEPNVRAIKKLEKFFKIKLID